MPNGYIIGNGAASDTTLQGLGPAHDYQVTTQDKTVVHSGVLTGTSQWYDMTTDDYASAVVDTDFQLNIKQPAWGGDVKVENLTPGVVSLDQAGLASVLASGTARFRMTHPVAGERLVEREVEHISSGFYSVLGAPMAGTLLAHVTDTLKAAALGKTATNATIDIYTGATFDKAAPAGTINPGLWAGMDFSASSFMAASTSLNFPIQLISPRHGLFAKHIGYGNGTKVLFLDHAGQFHSANILSQQWITSDVTLCYFDAAIPATITPYSLLPADWAHYLPTMAQSSAAQYRVTIPAVLRSASTGNGPAPTASSPQATVLDLNTMAETIYSDLNTGDSVPGFGKPVIGGDSSSPAVIPVNGVSVVLSSWYALTPGPNNTAGPPALTPMYADYLTQIEAAMNTLAADANTAGQTPADSTVYTVNKVDLTGFTRF